MHQDRHQDGHDAASYQRIEVITGERRRRSWSDAEKARIVAESADPETSISEVARRNGVNRGLLSVWRRQARLASSEAPQFVQVRLQAAVEAQPNAIDKAHVLTDPAERIEVMRAGPGCLDSAPLDLSGFLPGYAERGALRFWSLRREGVARPERRQNRRRRSCGHHHSLRAEVSLVGRAPVKARVRASLIVEGQILGN
ncbi:transposase-like protein [Bradyrhizobium liaoningense]